MNLLSNVHIAKRHSFASVLLGILALFSIFIPAVLWIPNLFSWLMIYVESVPLGSGFLTTGGDWMRINLIDFVGFLTSTGGESVWWVLDNAKAATDATNNILFRYITLENIYAVIGWYGISVILAIVLFIQGFVMLVRGKLTRKGAPVVVAFWAAVANGMLLFDSFRLGWYTNRIISKACTAKGWEGFSGVVTYFFPNIIIAAVAAGMFVLMFLVWFIGLRGRYYIEDIQFVDVDIEQKPFERNDGILRNTLPQGIHNVGGHAFAKNTNLEIANIAPDVKELGVGAFSNCLRLKTVSIPTSVKYIGSNCFFNCVKLRRINYAGTKQEWRRIQRGSNWLSKAATSTVVCSDGPVSVDPYK